MVRTTTCEQCLNNEHTKQEHESIRKKVWYEKTNYRDVIRIKRREERGSVRVLRSKYDKKLGRDFNDILERKDIVDDIITGAVFLYEK